MSLYNLYLEHMHLIEKSAEEQLAEPQFDESHINNIKDARSLFPPNDSGDKQAHAHRTMMVYKAKDCELLVLCAASVAVCRLNGSSNP
jgi:hypothetical protein